MIIFKRNQRSLLAFILSSHVNAIRKIISSINLPVKQLIVSRGCPAARIDRRGLTITLVLDTSCRRTIPVGLYNSHIIPRS
jgi:hypothetical protein